MAGQEYDVYPGSLDLSYQDRRGEFSVLPNYNTMARRLYKQGAVASLGEGAIEEPWSAFIDMTSNIEDATAELMPDNKRDFTNTIIQFAEADSREQFHTFYDHTVGSTAGLHMPHERSIGERDFRITNFSHADVSSIGRISTVFFREEWRSRIGKHNLRPLMTATNGGIEDNGILRQLPARLRAHHDAMRERHGEAARDMLFTSGDWGIVGAAVRKPLNEAGLTLTMQRPRNERNRIEEGITFSTTKKSQQAERPISGVTVTGKLGEQVVDRLEDIRRPLDRRDWGNLTEQGVDWATSIVNKAAALLIRGTYTAIGPHVYAVSTMALDTRRRHRYESE